MKIFSYGGRVLLDPDESGQNGGGQGAAEATPPSAAPSGESQPPSGAEPPKPQDDKPPGSSPAGEPTGFEKALDALQPEGTEGSQPPGGAGPDGGDKAAGHKDGQPAAAAKPADPALPKEQEAALTKAFDERPEWKGILTLAGANAEKVKPFLRQVFQRETALAGQIETLKPDAELGGRLKAAAVDEHAAANAVALVERWFAGDPAALGMLKELSNDLETRLGQTLSSPDLVERARKIDEQVDALKLTSEEAAAKKADLIEIEKARAGTKAATGKVKQTEQAQQQQRVEQIITQRTTALDDWEKLGPLKNPDYASRPKLRERVLNEAKLLVTERETDLNRVLNASEVVAVAQQAYESVMGFVSEVLPKPREERVTSGGGPSGGVKPRPKSYSEALDSAGSVL